MLFHDCGSPLELLWGQGVDTCLKRLWEDYAHANLNCKRYWENWPILSFLLGHFFKLGQVFQTKLWTDGSDLDPSVWPHCKVFPHSVPMWFVWAEPSSRAGIMTKPCQSQFSNHSSLKATQCFPMSINHRTFVETIGNRNFFFWDDFVVVVVVVVV